MYFPQFNIFLTFIFYVKFNLILWKFCVKFGYNTVSGNTPPTLPCSSPPYAPLSAPLLCTPPNAPLPTYPPLDTGFLCLCMGGNGVVCERLKKIPQKFLPPF